ncbi:MAG: hypothetical protein ACK5HY_05530, partial [Parahaliea sp.]
WKELRANDDVALLDAAYAPAGSGGALSLSGVSLAFDLSTQVDAFLLATLSFTADQVGETLLSVGSALLSDGFGMALSSTHYGATLNIDARDTGTPVSSPATALLLLTGLGLDYRRSRLSLKLTLPG